MHNINFFVTKRKRNYNTTNMFVSKRNLLVIYETTFKNPKLIPRKCCAVSCGKFENRGLINWYMNRKMVDEKFCIGILLIRYIPSVFSW